MKASTYDFRRFQEELAALDRGNSQAKDRPMPKKEPPQTRFLAARAEFLALRERYELTVADVVAFFPEDEGIAYLQALIAAKETKPRRRAKRPGQHPL
jgi:hypothetical protein